MEIRSIVRSYQYTDIFVQEIKDSTYQLQLTAADSTQIIVENLFT